MEALAVDRAVLQSFFLIIIFIKWEYQPKECSGPSAHIRDILLETFVPQKMLKKLQDLLRLVWTKNILSYVTAGLFKKFLVPNLCGYIQTDRFHNYIVVRLCNNSAIF